MALPVAVQLFSLRNEMEKDLEGTLRAVKAMGYDGVEFAGLFDYEDKPEELKKLVEEIGLTPISAHVTIDEYLTDKGGIDGVLDRYAAVGVKYVVIPYLTEERRPGGPRFNDASDENNTVAVITKIAEAASKKGLLLLYHNHDFEFKTVIDGKYALEVLYDSIPADIFQSELDTCWVNIGGEVPADYITRKFTGRAPVVHLKDFYMRGSLPKHLYALIGIDEEEGEAEENTFEFRPVGSGMQDFPAILKASVEAGANWVVVEQDEPTPGMTPTECVTKAIAYVKGLDW